MLRARLLPCIIVLALAGCGRTEKVTAPVPARAEDLSGVTYNLVARNPDESVILLGRLRFGPVDGAALAGTWELRQWSGPAVIPGLPAEGPFTGTLSGSTVILEARLADPQASLGLVSEGFVDGRLAGRMSLLPSLGFDGRFEAIRAVDPQ